MDPHSILVNMAVPAATGSARMVASAAADIGQRFVSVLGNFNSSEGTEGSFQEGLPIGQRLGQLADDLRGWIRQQGIDSPFTLDFQVASDGDKQMRIGGGEAGRIRDLLERTPEWQAALSELAEKYQSELQQLGDADITLHLSETDSSVALR